MTFRLAGAMAAVAMATAIGCSKASPSLVGTWTTQSQSRGLPTETEATFEPDGKYRAVTRYLNNGRIEMTATDTGTWKLVENKLTIRLTDVDWTIPDAKDRKAAEAAELFRQNKTAIMASVNEAGPIAVTWTTPDEISCTVAQGSFKYRRKK